jgi:hypothetical protein
VKSQSGAFRHRAGYGVALVTAGLVACTSFTSGLGAPPGGDGGANANEDAGSIGEAGVNDAPAGDVVGGGGVAGGLFPPAPDPTAPPGFWCRVNQGDHAFCSDFDADGGWPSGQVPPEWNAATISSGGTVASDSTRSTSAPASARFSGNGGAYSLDAHDPHLVRSHIYAGIDLMPHGTSYGFDALVVGGFVGIVGFCRVTLRLSSSATSLVVTTVLDGGYEGGTFPLGFPNVPAGVTVIPEKWSRVEIAVDLSANPAFAVVRIAGSVSDPVPLPDICRSLTSDQVDRLTKVGLCGDDSPSTTATANVDNVLLN